MLAQLVNEEPAEVFTPLERFHMQAIGIEKGKPFNPDPKTKALLSEAARTGSRDGAGQQLRLADARHVLLRGPPVAVRRRRALQLHEGWRPPGGSPGLRLLHGAGQLAGHDGEERRRWARTTCGRTRTQRATFLDGAKNYKLHIPAKVPAKDFWSVLVYDSLSRSELKNGQKFPSVSQYTDPKVNADGSVDVYFGPEMPEGQEKNWIKTVAGKGWFPIFRFYGPLEPLYDKTWVLPDIEPVTA